MSRIFKWAVSLLLVAALGASGYLNYLQYEYWAWLQDAPIFLHKNSLSGDVYAQVPYKPGRYVVRGMCAPGSERF